MTARRIALLAGLGLLAAVVAGCAGPQVTTSFSDRLDRIAAKISEAERLGARDCAPRELAHAKVALEHVRHEAMELHSYPRDWMHAEFDRVENIADRLLEKRRIAASLGDRFRCFRPGG